VSKNKVHSGSDHPFWRELIEYETKFYPVASVARLHVRLNFDQLLYKDGFEGRRNGKLADYDKDMEDAGNRLGYDDVNSVNFKKGNPDIFLDYLGKKEEREKSMRREEDGEDEEGE